MNQGESMIQMCIRDRAVRDWRGVVRIANVPVAALGKRKGEEGFVDLQKLTIEAKNRMPQHLRQKAVWYANADVLTALELQNSDAGQVQLHYEMCIRDRPCTSACNA